jgi:hypothetical protein
MALKVNPQKLCGTFGEHLCHTVIHCLRTTGGVQVVMLAISQFISITGHSIMDSK